MARAIVEQKIDTRTARDKRPLRGKPYWREIDPGLHLGSRKGKTKGVWCVRWPVGGDRVLKYGQAGGKGPRH